MALVRQDQAVPPSIVLIHQPSIAAAASCSSCRRCCYATGDVSPHVMEADRQGCVGQQADRGAQEQVSIRLVCCAGCGREVRCGGGGQLKEAQGLQQNFQRNRMQ